MKIGIIGDQHFGSGFNLGKIDPETQLNSRLLDYEKTFNTLIDQFEDRGVESIILTGDCFETRNPHPSQLNVLCKCLTRATDKGMKIYIVVGNHDQTRGTLTTSVDIFNHLQIPNIRVFQEPAIQSIDDFHLIFMPFRDRIMMNSDTHETAYQLLRDQIQGLIKDKTGTKILVGHFMLEKTEEDNNPDSFGIKELVLPLDIFAGIDVVVMGHIHRHEVKSEANPVIIYSGSMEKNTFGERDHEKVSIVIDTNAPNKYDIIETKTRPLVELNFDYSELEPFKDQITEKILEDVDASGSIKDAIVRLIAKVKDVDLFHVKHQKIKEHLNSADIHNLMPLQISASTIRQLRNKNINENTGAKKAMMTFLDGTSESDPIKEKLKKAAAQIIEEIEGGANETD
jgi:exonuclease SbcD